MCVRIAQVMAFADGLAVNVLMVFMDPTVRSHHHVLALWIRTQFAAAVELSVQMGIAVGLDQCWTLKETVAPVAMLMCVESAEVQLSGSTFW